MKTVFLLEPKIVMNALSNPSFKCLPLVVGALVLLGGCSAKTEDTSSSSAAPVQSTAAAASAQVAFAPKLMDVFSIASGSSGNGVAMRELKSINGTLRQPEIKSDVYDADPKADLKTLKQDIQASLDRGHQVLIDSDGTPESRSKAAQISYEAIGASLPDASSFLIRKLPEERGGGYGLIPIYSQAEVAQQIAKGEISKPEEASNSVSNFFFEPPKAAQ